MSLFSSLEEGHLIYFSIFSLILLHLKCRFCLVTGKVRYFVFLVFLLGIGICAE